MGMLKTILKPSWLYLCQGQKREEPGTASPTWISFAPHYPKAINMGTMIKTTTLPLPPIKDPTLASILSRIPFFANFSSRLGEMER